MKRKYSKHILLCLVLTFILSLTACGEEEPLYFEVNESSMQAYTKKLIEKFRDTSKAEQDLYLNDGNELEKTAVSGFLAAQSTDHVGNFLEFAEGDDAVEISNGVDGKVLCSQICKYENRDVKVTISYKPNRAYDIDKEKQYNTFVNQAKQYNMQVTDYVVQMYGSYPELDLSSMDKFLDSYLAAVFDEHPYIAQDCEVSAVYSKGELIQNAGKNTAIGMGVVFLVLIFISFIISLLKFLPYLFDADIRKQRAEAKKAAEEAKKRTEDLIIGSKADNDASDKKASTAAPAAPAAAAVSSDENLINDSELVAVITAAIYAATGSAVRGPAYTASNDKLVVRSIRRAKR